MIAKMPIIASAAGAADIILASAGDSRAAREGFIRGLQASSRSRSVFLVDSGITAFVVALKALRRLSQRDEVILPAYTAGSLVVAVRVAGLKPVLCDISLDTFGCDPAQLAPLISGRTLAVAAVHMFGVGIDVQAIRELCPGVFIIEDCAQAMGSRIAGRFAGESGDIGFFSFNRGKNLPLSSGGCVVTNRQDCAEAAAPELAALEKGGPAIVSAARAFAFLAASRPFVYGAAFPLISRFKETAPPRGLRPRLMDDFTARLGARVIRREEDIFARRFVNGSCLRAGLQGVCGIRVARISSGDRPAYNRFPVLFDDPAALARAEKGVWDAGFESSRMYLRPLHHMFDLGYRPAEFPKAAYAAGHLLTLPSHPACGIRACEKMIAVIRRSL